MTIPTEHIDAAMRTLETLRAHPERDSFDYLSALIAFDRIEGRGALQDAIDDCAYDLGIDDGVECLACGQDTCGCDQAHDDRSTFDMVRF